MKNCDNREHLEIPCKENKLCFNCGQPTCSANFTYHICIKDNFKTNKGKKDWKGCIYVGGSRAKVV